ncbi:protein kinase [Acidobacteria bacterium AH-259-L09]|nr:protein kinase [Acidobacteria bacterium AH-259-L09]
MPLTPGTQLGPYEILSLLGAGGMGEVYKAKDTRLDRIVAIKVLPAHLSDNAVLRQRFEREAKTISSLNHPHICTLYDVGHQEGVDFLVMEYLEGETLGERLAKGSLPIEEGLKYAVEIADALDKAHRQGVVHRDLKPGNIMLTKAGAKLLDFGLAKLRGPEVAAAALSALPTKEASLTAEGAILGTFQYMAPEQLEGKEAEPRTDIFAFGAVLYEMITAKKAFEGKSQASLIGAILKDDPVPVSTVQAMAPAALDHVVKRCLAKDPDERWLSAHDLTLELKWIAEAGSEGGVPEPAPETSAFRSKTRQMLAWSLISLIVGAGIAGLAVYTLVGPTASVPRPLARVSVNLPENTSLVGTGAFSPDGTRLIYGGTSNGARQLYLRPLDQMAATPSKGTKNARWPFFSPDGQWVAFAAGGKLRKVFVGGGTPFEICDVTAFRGGSWGADDTIFFTPATSEGLWKVSAAGGTPQKLTAPDVAKGEYSHRWPEVLPGGKAVLFTVGVSSNYNEARIAVLTLETGSYKTLVKGGHFPRYSATGHVVFARGADLLAVPFDLEKLEVRGDPVPVLDGVSGFLGTGRSHFSLSQTGSLVYVPGDVGGRRNVLLWVSRRGEEEPVSEPGRIERLRLSPDGQRIAMTRLGGGNVDIWTYALSRRTPTRLTYDPGWDESPIWTPDGQWVTYSNNRAGRYHLFRKPADGSGTEELLHTSDHRAFPTSYSPDGRWLAFSENRPETGEDIWVLAVEAEREAEVFLRTPFNETTPQFSPDGGWIAYVSDESGQQEVYVTPFPGPGRKWQISTQGGSSPVWARNGKELFYRNGNQLMAVGVTTQPSFSAAGPRLLLEKNFGAYDVAPDGQRFLMTRGIEEEPIRQLIVILNWFEELQRLVPTGK